MIAEMNGVRCCGQEIEPVIDQWFTGSIGRVHAVWTCEKCGTVACQPLGWIEPSEAEIIEPEVQSVE